MTDQRQTVLITGGAGFIGSHMAEAFLRAGKTVAVIDNFNDYYDPAIKRRRIQRITEQFGAERFHCYEADIRDKAAMADLCRRHGDAVVIHLAASAGVRPSIENPALYFDVNVMGTLNLLSAMQSTGMRRLVFASSSSVYGNSPEALFTEEHGDTRPVSPYAASKRSAELLCHTFHHLYGMTVASLRFFTVYGPRQRADLAIHLFTKRMLADEPIQVFGDGQSIRDYTYIDDIVAGIAAAVHWVLDNDNRFEIFNLGGGSPVTLNRLIETLESAIGKKAVIRRQPTQTGDVPRTAADLTKAARVLGYHPRTDFDTGIRRFVEWVRSAQE